MTKDIRDSDTIPNDDDRANGEEMFVHDGRYSMEKIANTVARLHRKEREQSDKQKGMDATLTEMGTSVNMLDGKLQTHIDKSNKNHRMVMECLQGDELGMNPGLIEMTKTIHKQVTGKDATTDEHKKKEDNEITKYVWMILGGLVLLSVLIGAGMIRFGS